MYKIPLTDLKAKITASNKLTEEQLDTKIKEKINELSGLISEEGAAHIIANELGITLVNAQEKLKIKEIYAGMRNVSTVGKVVQKYETREFQKGDRTGKVCSLVIGDETGTIRLVLWNDQVDQAKDLAQESIILVKDAFVKENNNSKEIHLGKLGEIIPNPEGETITTVRQSSAYERKTIGELQGGEEQVEMMGTIVQVFDPRFFQVKPKEGQPPPTELSYVMNLILDDGTGTVRTVFWKNQVNHLLNKTAEEMVSFKDDLTKFEDYKTDLLGEQLKLMGRVKKNDMFDRLEFHVQFVEKANPQEEIARLTE